MKFKILAEERDRKSLNQGKECRNHLELCLTKQHFTKFQINLSSSGKLERKVRKFIFQNISTTQRFKQQKIIIFTRRIKSFIETRECIPLHTLLILTSSIKYLLKQMSQDATPEQEANLDIEKDQRAVNIKEHPQSLSSTTQAL